MTKVKSGHHILSTIFTSICKESLQNWKKGKSIRWEYRHRLIYICRTFKVQTLTWKFKLDTRTRKHIRHENLKLQTSASDREFAWRMDQHLDASSSKPVKLYFGSAAPSQLLDKLILTSFALKPGTNLIAVTWKWYMAVLTLWMSPSCCSWPQCWFRFRHRIAIQQ